MATAISASGVDVTRLMMAVQMLTGETDFTKLGQFQMAKFNSQEELDEYIASADY